MGWTAAKFRNRIFVRYWIELLGWPPHIPFKNPGKAAMADIRELQTLLDAGELRFVDVPAAERTAGNVSIARACPAVLFDPPLPDYGRRNVGRRAAQCFDTHGNVRPRRFERNGPKSMKLVEGVVDSAEPYTEDGLPQMFKDRVHMVYKDGSWWPVM